MYLTLQFTLAEEDEKSATYVERVEEGKHPVVGNIIVDRSSLSQPTPLVLNVGLNFQELRSAPPPHVAGSGLVRPNLKPGDEVTIVKNRIGGVKSSPEWLAQYLGRTGAVLWASELGAMVQFAEGVTWFPYAELELRGT